MTVATQQFSLAMRGDTQVENITERVQKIIGQGDIDSGIVTIFVKHTTASVMVFEDEPGLHADTKVIWNRLIPADPEWQHNTRNPGEDNAHSHLRSQIQGQSLTVPFVDRKLTLGTWQQIVVVDFDTRARNRDIVVQVIG